MKNHIDHWKSFDLAAFISRNNHRYFFIKIHKLFHEPGLINGFVELFFTADDLNTAPVISFATQLIHKRKKARSEEHTSELKSLMRISYAVFCLKKNKNKPHDTH